MLIFANKANLGGCPPLRRPDSYSYGGV